MIHAATCVLISYPCQAPGNAAAAQPAEELGKTGEAGLA